MPIKLVTHYIVVRFVFFSKFNFQLLIANAIKKLIQAFRVNCSFRQLVGQRVIEILHLSKLLAHRLHQPECYNRSGISSESGALGDRARVAVGHYTTPPSTIYIIRPCEPRSVFEALDPTVRRRSCINPCMKGIK